MVTHKGIWTPLKTVQNSSRWTVEGGSIKPKKNRAKDMGETGCNTCMCTCVPLTQQSFLSSPSTCSRNNKEEGEGAMAMAMAIGRIRYDTRYTDSRAQEARM